MKILIFSNTYSLVSGGDVIFVEMAKKWIKAGQSAEIITNEKGKLFCLDRNFPSEQITLWRSSRIDHLGVFIAEIYKAAVSSWRAVFFRSPDLDIIFASSFFWPDIFAGVITKIKYPKAKLVVGIYLLFPTPFGKVQYSGGLFKAISLSISQAVSLFLTKKFADIVLTASTHERDLLYNGHQLSNKTVIAIRGGVDIRNITRIKRSHKKFSCVYFGRFHSQKGLLDLLDIWKLVLRKKPAGKLLLAGGGALEQDIKERARQLNILHTITFSGIVSGSKKYRLLKSAKVFISASRFDTGNIALDEVLACGVPGVVYDLSSLNYEAGVVKVPLGNKKKMANHILSLLDNPGRRKKLGQEGQNFIKRYDWSKVSKRVLSLFQSSPL